MKADIVVLAVLAIVVPVPAFAGAPFGSADVTSAIFCDMPSIKGVFTAPEARYNANGVCVKLTANQNKPAGSSQFDDYNNSREDYRVQWTAEGGYNPATKDTWETVTAPAPGVNEPSPPGRPYGRFISRMICAQDPWLNSSTQCVSVSTSVTGNLGPKLAETMKRGGSRPFTSFPKGPQRDAMVAAKKREENRFTDQIRKDVQGSPYQQAMAAPPIILEPKPGSIHSPQTAMKIRVGAPRIINFKAQSYELQFQSKQQDGTWKFVTSDITPAADAEGNGYYGWGAHKPGTPPQMTATLGTFRVRALVKEPAQLKQPELNIGEWVEYVIAGAPRPDIAGALISDTAKLETARGAAGRASAYSNAAPQAAAQPAAKMQMTTPATQRSLPPDAAVMPSSTLRR
jgi:hypothetical protein